ncbi:MAG: response regulator transcription factor [Anaerohalosphaeraceae bacterium]
MTKKKQLHIFLVDDDKAILDSASFMLKKHNYECSCFDDANSCLLNFTPRDCDLLITDIHMPGIDGIDLLNQVKKMAPWIPVVIMTSYADIPKAVHAVKSGAFDFIEKPFEVENFIEIVKLALRQNQLNHLDVGKPLTKTEKIILKLILDGKSNKGIAYMLQRSERTIEVHRSHIMRKLNVDNVVDLVKRASSLSGFEKSE